MGFVRFAAQKRSENKNKMAEIKKSISNNVDSSLLHSEMARREGDASRRWVHRWLSLITLLTCLSVQVSAQMVRTRPLVNRLVARPH